MNQTTDQAMNQTTNDQQAQDEQHNLRASFEASKKISIVNVAPDGEQKMVTTKDALDAEQEVVVTLRDGQSIQMNAGEYMNAILAGDNRVVPGLSSMLSQPEFAKLERLFSAKFVLVKAHWPDSGVSGTSKMNDLWAEWFLKQIAIRIEPLMHQAAKNQDTMIVDNLCIRVEPLDNQFAKSRRTILNAHVEAMLILSDPDFPSDRETGTRRLTETLGFLKQHGLISQETADDFYQRKMAKAQSEHGIYAFETAKQLFLKALSPDSGLSMHDQWVGWLLTRVRYDIGAIVQLPSCSERQRQVLDGYVRAARILSNLACWDDKARGLSALSDTLSFLGQRKLIDREEMSECWREAVREATEKAGLRYVELGFTDTATGKPRPVDLEREEVNFIHGTGAAFITNKGQSEQLQKLRQEKAESDSDEAATNPSLVTSDEAHGLPRLHQSAYKLKVARRLSRTSATSDSGASTRTWPPWRRISPSNSRPSE